MPIRGFPFLQITPDNLPRPWLPVTILNPETGKSFRTYGLVDTGADACAIPASIASIIGHKLRKGKIVESMGASGKVVSYYHTTKIEIVDLGGDVLFTIDHAPIEYSRKLPCVLLGVRHFLDQFALNIDYPKRIFSIKYSKKSFSAP